MLSIETDGFAACFNGPASRQYHSLCPHVVSIMHFATPPQLANVTYKSCEAFADASRRLARFVHSQNHAFLIGGKKKKKSPRHKRGGRKKCRQKHIDLRSEIDLQFIFLRARARARARANISRINEWRYEWRLEAEQEITESKFPSCRWASVRCWRWKFSREPTTNGETAHVSDACAMFYQYS